MKKLITILTFFSSVVTAQTLTTDETILFNKLNDYRLSCGLKRLPLNDKLCTVAKLHATNVQENKKKLNKYNPHSWFKDKRWTEVLIQGEAKSEVVTKATEITGYKSDAYEVIYYTSDVVVNPVKALSGWQHSIGHNNTILCKSVFKDFTWKSCGVAIVNGIACIWFGEVE